MFVDLDRFKRINDSLGHAVGDKLLVEIAARLRASLRDDDTVAAWVATSSSSCSTTCPAPTRRRRWARRMVAELRRPVNVEGRELVVTTSVGVAVSRTTRATPTPWSSTRTWRCTAPRTTGRNSFQLFEPAMNARSLERLALETALHRALPRDELQPTSSR